MPSKSAIEFYALHSEIHEVCLTKKTNKLFSPIVRKMGVVKLIIRYEKIRENTFH